MTAGLAWVSESYGMRVVDVGNPSEPVVAGSLDTWLYVENVAVSGDYSFLTGSVNLQGPDKRGMWVIDSSDALASREIAFLETPDFIEDIEVCGEHAYLAVREWGLRVIDVTDPADPNEVGFLETTGDVRQVAVAGTIAFIGDQEGRLLAVDVSDPSAPHPISLIETSGPVGEYEVEEPYLYLAQGYEGLRIIDYSDPFNPTEAGYLIADEPLGAITVDDRAYLILVEPVPWGPGYDYDLVGFDIRDAAHPVEIVNLSIGFNGGGDIAVANEFVYLPRSELGLDILAGCAPPPPRLPDGRPGW